MAANVGEIRAKMTVNTSQFKKGLKESREEMEKTQKSAKETSRSVDGIQTASLAVAGAVAIGIGASVKVAANFEQAMARVKAVSGATETEFIALRDIAKEMGETTEFSAVQAAEALTFLSMAGFNASEQISSLPSVLNLASAAQIDLGRSADIVSNIMTGFGIGAQDTGNAVDVLVKTMTTANTDLTQLGDAMKYIAPVASSLGFSIEETAAAVAKMSDAGIQGTMAGTALRASFLSLANPVGQTAEAMVDYNIEVKNAEGNMKPLPELVGHISERFEGLTDAQKTQAAAQLVGTEAASGFISLLAVGEDGLRDYVTELQNADGVASDVAKTQKDTLNGSFKEFQSAMEGLGIAIGDEFLPVFKDVVEKATDFVRVLGNLNPKVVATTGYMAGTAAAIGLVLTTVYKLSGALRLLAANPIGLAISGLVLLGGAIAGVVAHNRTMNEVNLDTVNELAAQRDELDKNIVMYDELAAKNRLTTDEMARFLDIQSEINNTVDETKIKLLSDQQAELLDKSGLTNEEMQRFVDINNKIVETVPDATVKITEQGNALIENTEAAKKLNKEQLETIKFELERQRAKAESTITSDLADQERLTKEINKDLEDIAATDDKIAEKEAYINELREKANKLTEDHQLGERTALLHEANVIQKVKLEYLKDEKDKIYDNVEANRKDLVKTQEKIAKLKEVEGKLIDIEIQQLGINASKEDALSTVENEIIALERQKQKLGEGLTAQEKQSAEYREQVEAIDEQINELEGVKSKVVDILVQSGYLNESLARSITKRVTIQEKYNKFGSIGTYHSGGIVTPPKLHSGGTTAQLKPMHNEIDVPVRLLQNEMVLTEAQQSNLMRMIDAGFTGNAQSGTSVPSVINNSTTINVEGNIDKDLYASIMRRQAEDTRMKSRLGGIKE